MPQPPYRIDPSAIRRFDGRCTAFAREREDRPQSGHVRAASGRRQPDTPDADVDRDRCELAEARAAWRVKCLLDSALPASSEDDAVSQNETSLARYLFASPEEASADIKAVATRFGACLSGITRINPLWVYSHDGNGNPLELPEWVGFAVVIAVAMSREQIRQSPGPIAAAAVGRGYSAMAAVTVSVAEYISLLGYRALPSGNDTALSIPLAIDAGLGTLGRNGLLLTSEHGPFIRLCKVFTDLPLAPDGPAGDSPDTYCATCARCATACPVEAISDAPEPSFETAGPCNRPGVARWAVDAERCLSFWQENGTDCSTCIAVCPYGAA